MNIDPNGNFFLSFLIGLGIAALIGAGVGAVAYTASEVISYALTGEWNWSWGDFLGSTIGGLLSAPFTLLPIMGLYISAFVSGLTSTIFSDLFNNIFYGKKFDLLQSTLSGGLNGLISIGLSAIMKNVFKFNGINSGRGNWSAVSDQIYTKFKRNIIKKISWKTFGKMLGTSLYGSLLDPFYDALK